MLLNFVFFLTDPDPDPNCEHLYLEKRIIFGKVSRKKIHFFSVILFCCNAALRTTRGSLYVCMSVCLRSLAFLSFTQKIFKYISKKVAAYRQFVLVLLLNHLTMIFKLLLWFREDKSFHQFFIALVKE